MTDSHLIFAHVLDERGGSRVLDEASLATWRPTMGPLWVHLDLEQDATHRWVEQEAGVSEDVAEALLDEETRPRALLIEDGVLLNLRGINAAPSAPDDDMVAVRLFVDENRVISVRRRALHAARQLARRLTDGGGPIGPGDVVADLADLMNDACEPVIDALEETLDELEESGIEGEVPELSDRLAEVRRSVIRLRRHLAPQRVALQELAGMPFRWLQEEDRDGLAQAADGFTRLVEDLELLRERAVVLQDQLENRRSEQLERRTYLLSLIAAVFLPLHLVAGMLGMNVGGVPFGQSPTGFVVVSLLIAVAGVAMVILLRRLRWI